MDGVLRDDSYDQFVEMVSAGQNGWGFDGVTATAFYTIAIVLVPLLVVQSIQLWSKDLEFVLKWPFVARCTAYALLLLILVLFGVSSGDAFIYFQF